MRKLILLSVVIALLIIVTVTANANFIDNFDSGYQSWLKWDGVDTYMVDNNPGILRINPPSANSEIRITSKDKFLYGTYDITFRTTNDGWNYLYFGFCSRDPWVNPSAMWRVDGNLMLCAGNGPGQANWDALSPNSPYVVPGVWHNLRLIWKPGLLSAIYDGNSLGSTTQNVTSTPLPLVMDAIRYTSSSTSPLVFEVSSIKVTPIMLQQIINGISVKLDLYQGIRLISMGSGINSSSGRLFGIKVGDRRIYSDEVTVRAQEIIQSSSELQVPFDLPDGLGSGVMKFSAGSEPDVINTSLTLTSGQSAKWRVLFPLIEKLTIDSIAQDQIEFFFPFQEGWVGRGLYDISTSYGHRAWLPILAAWNPSGSGIAIQSRDATFTYRSLHFRNTSSAGNCQVYNGADYLGVVSAFPADSTGLSMSVCPIEFNLASGNTWTSASSAIQVYNGSKLFKAPFKSYENWARATWWTHRKTPDWLRDSFLSFAVLEHFGNAGFARGLYNGYEYICAQQAETYKNTMGGHPFVEMCQWWTHGEKILTGPYFGSYNPFVGMGDYNYEPRWGGLPAFQHEIESCHDAGARVCLYLLGGSVWKTTHIGQEHALQWGVMRTPGVIEEVWSGDVWYGITTQYWDICSEAVGWQEFLRDKSYQLLTETGADAVRLDTKAEALICINPNHPHNGDPLRGLLTYLQTIRQGVNLAGDDKALMGEFAGSDAAAQYFDSALAQGHDITNPLVSQMTLYGISPFRYVFPEMKCIEWGNVPADYHQTTRRMLFNGIGITAGDLNNTQLLEVTKFAEAMRKVGDILASTDCEPLVSTLVDKVYANRFSLNGREVYTLWNQTGSDKNDYLINIPGSYDRKFVDLLTGIECQKISVSGGTKIKIALPNNEVAIIGVFPKLTGKIDLLNYTGDITKVPITLEFNGEPKVINIGADGRFTITEVGLGTYNIRITAPHWLAKTIYSVVVAGNTVMDPVSLVNGDVVNNNEVDFSDINAVRAAYGSFPGDNTWNEMADVNGSGEVDFTDINIVRVNYGEIGD